MYQPSSKWVPWVENSTSIKKLHERRAANQVAGDSLKWQYDPKA